jgi:hypothetical protein
MMGKVAMIADSVKQILAALAERLVFTSAGKRNLAMPQRNQSAVVSERV